MTPSTPTFLVITERGPLAGTVRAFNTEKDARSHVAQHGSPVNDAVFRVTSVERLEHRCTSFGHGPGCAHRGIDA